MAQPRALLIGASSPIGYDYTREKVDGVPYPVLEDLWGILLCYDELWFLSRAFCPSDMWSLPYVRFLDEEPGGVDMPRLRIAADQFQDALRTSPAVRNMVGYPEVVARIVGTEPNLVDNHSRPVRLAEDWHVTGNAGRLELLVADMGIAAALDTPRLDVLNNTLGTGWFAAPKSLEAASSDEGFGPWHIDVAHELASLRVPNRYEAGRTYVPDIEELRTHPNIREFRAMLSQADWTASEASEAAADITDMADRFARRHVAKTFRHRPWYRTLSKIAVGPAGNLVHPGLGSAANGGLRVLDYWRSRDDRRVGGWAAFVVSLRD